MQLAYPLQVTTTVSLWPPTTDKSSAVLCSHPIKSLNSHLQPKFLDGDSKSLPLSFMTLPQKSSADGNSLQRLPFYPTPNISSFIPIQPSFQLIAERAPPLMHNYSDTNLSRSDVLVSFMTHSSLYPPSLSLPTAFFPKPMNVLIH